MARMIGQPLKPTMMNSRWYIPSSLEESTHSYLTVVLADSIKLQVDIALGSVKLAGSMARNKIHKKNKEMNIADQNFRPRSLLRINSAMLIGNASPQMGK